MHTIWHAIYLFINIVIRYVLVPYGVATLKKCVFVPMSRIRKRIRLRLGF